MRTLIKVVPLGIALILTLSDSRLLAQKSVSENPSTEIISLDGRIQRQVIYAKNAVQNVRFQHLTPGETYSLKVPKDPISGFCTPSVRLLATGSQLLSSNDAAHEIQFRAAAETVDFQFEYPCSWNEASHPAHYVSLQCQSCRKQNFNEYLRSSADISALANLQVTPNSNAYSLVRDVLIGGDCFDISNVQFHGQPTQIGTFSNGQTNIGISEGVIMATGNVLVATGPNTTDNADQGFGNYTPDSELGELSAGGDCFDMAFLEFDFRPTQSSVQFDFVFASEEYCEYVGTPFNDVFGFFISGPGINGPFNGAENIALVPSTNTYVAINNVNHLLYPAYFVNNTPVTGLLCGQPGVSLPTITQTQFDGYTKKITVRATLQTCQTYHIKLKISDVADGIFDSAVFLRAGSFNAGTTASMHWMVDGQLNATQAYENCSNASLVVRRVGGNPGLPLTVNYTVSGTASAGSDFTGIPGSVTIPAGQQQVIIPVNILADAISENPETIQIMPSTLCNCSRPEEVLTILDVQPVLATGDSISICEPGTATVGVHVQGGAPPYAYLWENGETNPSFSTDVAATQTYRVTVTDNCQVTRVATARVEVEAPVTAHLQSPAPQLCFGQADSLTVLFTGEAPYTLNYTFNGAPQPPVTNIQSSPFKLLVSQPGIYALTAVSGGACQGTASGTLEVTEAFIEVNATVSDVTCAGMNNGSIVTASQGGQPPYSYTWSGPQAIAPDTASPGNLSPGTYQLTVSDAQGCRALKQYTISEPEALVATIVDIQGTNCDQPSEGGIDLNVSGGRPAYQFLWSNSAELEDPQDLNFGTYTVTITDQSGCTVTLSAVVPGDFVAPIAVAQSPGPLTCTNPTVSLSGNGSSTGAVYSYVWAPPNGVQIVSGETTLQPLVNMPGTYTLFVRNTLNGCVSSVSVEQTEIIDYPQVDAGTGSELSCLLRRDTLDASGSSQGSQFTYQWTAAGNGVILSGSNTQQPVVGSGGIYSLLVTNQQNGCTGTDSVVVTENFAAPVGSIALPDSFSCLVPSVLLTGNAAPSAGVSYHWTTMDGLILSGQNTPQALAAEPGLYTMIVTFDQTGCADTVSVSVVQNFAEPLANVIAHGALTCIDSLVELDASSSVLSANTTLSWSASNGGNFVSGNQTLTPVINTPGTYTLLLTDNISNCSSSATIVIEDHSELPPADAGLNAVLTCNDTIAVLGTSSANPAYVYTWTAGNGGHLVSGADTPTAAVDAPGTYFMSVFNPVNGCLSIDSVEVSENVQSPLAVASYTNVLDCATSSVQLSGAGSSTGAGFTYAWTSATSNGILSGEHTLTPTVALATTYTLVVTNASNGCQASASTTLPSNGDIPAVTAVPLGILTCANQQVIISGQGSATGAGISYNWTSSAGSILAGQGTLQATVGAPGFYTLQVTNASSNCTATYTVEVQQDTNAPVANAGAGQTLICTTPNITLDGSASDTGTNITYLWSAISGGNFISATNIQNPTVNESGIYQIQVTDMNNGCTSVDQVEIGADPNDPVVQIATPGALNCTIMQVLLNANASSTGSQFTYDWTGPGIVSGDSTLQLQVNGPGAYQLHIVNLDNGCTTTGTVNVALDTLAPVALAGPDNIINCNASQILLGNLLAPALPQLTYSWTGPRIISGSDNPTAVADSAGIYNLVVINNLNGCTATDAVQITADLTRPQADAGDSFELDCNTTSDTLNATASQGSAFTYQWTTDTGSFLSPQNILQPIVGSEGTYFLTVSNTQNGCSSTDSVFISAADDAPVAIITPPQKLTCNVTNLLLNGGNSSVGVQYQYQWTTSNGGNILAGQNSLNPLIDAPGDYMLQVRDVNSNCISSSVVTVQQNIEYPDVSIAAPPLLTCAMPVGALQCMASLPGNYAFQWFAKEGGLIIGGGLTNHPLISSKGKYIVYIANLENGCIATDSVVVNADQEMPHATIPTPDTLTCIHPEVVLQVNADALPLTYTWSTLDGHFVDAPESEVASVDVQGIYEVIVTNTTNGCWTPVTVQVLENKAPPVAEAGIGGEITCSVVTLALNGNSSSTGPLYSYQWTTTDGHIQSGAQSLAPVITKGGTYALQVTNDSNGCSATDFILIHTDTVAPSVNILPAAPLTCQQDQTTLQSNVGTGVFLYEWSTSTGNIVSGQNAPNALVNASGMYQLIATSLQNGCTDTASVTVSSQVVLPDANAGPSLKLTCTTKEVWLQGTAAAGPGITYSWSTQGGQILSGANTLHPLVDEEGLYMLTVIDQNTGCVNSDTARVNIETNVPTGFLVDVEKPTCKNAEGIIQFTEIEGGVGPYTYSIDGGTTFDPVPEFEELTAGTYLLRIRDANGCEWSKTLQVIANPQPNISVIPEINLVLGQSFDLQAHIQSYPLALIDTITWTPTEGLYFQSYSIFDLLNPLVRPYKSTEYTVTVTSIDGCSASDRVLVRVDDEPRVYIPNAFSPWNNDNQNDIVFVSANVGQVTRIRRFSIYDRWGELVYQAENFQPNDPTFGWDGWYRGKLMDPAVFVYEAEIDIIDGRVIVKSGDITLVR